MCSSSTIIYIGTAVPLAAGAPAAMGCASFGCSRRIISHHRRNWAPHPAGALMIVSGVVLLLEMALRDATSRGLWIIAPMAATCLLTGFQTISITSAQFALPVPMACGLVVAAMAQHWMSAYLPELCASRRTPAASLGTILGPWSESTSTEEWNTAKQLWSGNVTFGDSVQHPAKLLALVSILCSTLACIVALGWLSILPSAANLPGSCLGVHEEGVNSALIRLLAKRKAELDKPTGVNRVSAAPASETGPDDSGPSESRPDDCGPDSSVLRRRRGRQASSAPESAISGSAVTPKPAESSRTRAAVASDSSDAESEASAFDPFGGDDSDDDNPMAVSTSLGMGGSAVLPVDGISKVFDDVGMWQEGQQTFTRRAQDAIQAVVAGAFRDWMLRSAEADSQAPGASKFRVVDLGCGAGGIAREMLQGFDATLRAAGVEQSAQFPSAALVEYLGVDASRVMVQLAGKRLDKWSGAAVVRQDVTRGKWLQPKESKLSETGAIIEEGTADVVMVLWLLDCMGTAQMNATVELARRALRPDTGVLVLACAGAGGTPAADACMGGRLWCRRVCPSLVCGVGVLEGLELLTTGRGWRVLGWQYATQACFTSEVIVALVEDS